MAVVGRLAASVIHDLNNMLTIIQLNAAMLEIEGTDSAEGVKLIEEINRACSCASDLTRSVLNVSRRNDRASGLFEAGNVLKSMAPLLAVLAGRKAVLHMEYPAGKIWIDGSSTEFQQVILNLVANAVEAEPKSGVWVSAQSVSSPEGKKLVELVVRDTGRGMAPEVMAHIFEAFYTTKTPGGNSGTGLGLSIVHRIISDRGGLLKVESVPEEGTTFRITFPESAPPESIVPAARPAPPKNRVEETILLVEDDPGIRAIGRQILEREGYHVLEAKSADLAHGIWTMNRQAVTLLFTDIVLPGNSSGIDLARDLLKEKPKLRVLYTSGQANIPPKSMISKNKRFLQKPFRPEELVQAVSSLLS